MSGETARVGFGPGSRVLITLAAAAAAIVGISLARDVLVPMVFAAVVVIIVHPLHGLVRRRGGPGWLATGVVILTAYAILAALGFLLLLALGQFVQLVPQYTDDLAAALAGVRDTLTGLGFDPATVDEQLAAADLGAVADALVAAASGVLGWGIAFVLVLAYILFAAVDAADYHELAVRFGETRGRMVAALRGFTSGVRRYMVVNAVFGLIVALLDYALLLVLQVPGALIWAVLAFVTNFIPNIGFVIGVIPPLLLALVTGGWSAALAVLVGYCVINFTLQELVQPKFVSDAVGLTLTISFASVIVWTAIIGPMGAILAVPLSLFLRAILFDVDPDAAWARALTGGRRRREPEPTGPAVTDA